MNEYQVGDRVRLFTATPWTVKATGLPFDPQTVKVLVRSPAGTVSEAPATKTATGEYEAEINVDEPGRWHYAFEGSAAGVNQGADEASFYVRKRKVTAP